MLDAGVAVIHGNLGEPGGRSYSSRSAQITVAQPRLQRLNQAQVRGRQGEDNVLVALSFRLQPGEPETLYSYGWCTSMYLAQVKKLLLKTLISEQLSAVCE
jgi:hypothetical protein